MENKQLLTNGPIVSALMRLAMPLIASAFMSTLYTLVDMFWVSKLGAEVVAGVGVAGMYLWLSSGVCKLASVGCQVYVAQQLGRGDRDEAENFAVAGVRLCILLGVLYGFVCLTCTGPMVAFFGLTSDAAIRTAINYTRICCGFVLARFLNYILANVFTAQGSSRIPMIANIVGLVLNIVIDPVLIFGWGPAPALGVEGSAIATVFSQIIVVLVIACNVGPGNVLARFFRHGRIKAAYYGAIFKLGIPSAVQEMFYCGISIVLSRLVASFGDVAMAVMRVGNQIEEVSWNSATGFGNAINAFVAQNYGAGKFDRIKSGYRASVWFVAGEGFIVTSIFIGFRKQIANAFFFDPYGIRIFCIYLIVVGVSELFMNVEMMTTGALAGLGQTRVASMICIAFTLIRLPIAYGLAACTELGSTSVWIALSASSIIKGVLMWAAFLRKQREAQTRAELQ